MMLYVRVLDTRYRIHKTRERLIRKVVWALPRSIVMWSAVRVIAHATTGPYGNQIVPELTAMDALKRWDEHPR